MRILYAAGNRTGSYFQLKRFIDSVSNKDIVLKISAFKKSMGNLDVDYTLDCLLNFAEPEGSFLNNGNYIYYFNEIKRFKPDLIISDMEVYTSLIALELGIKLWQASPLLLYNAITKELKYNSKIHKNYGYLINSFFRQKDHINIIVNNSDKRFVVSHLCDCDKGIQLIDNFEWVRPDFVLCDSSTSDVKFFSASMKNNKDIVNLLKSTNSIIFSEFYHEKYNKLLMKNIYDDKDYAQSIGKCNFYISDGTEVLTSDAFYNQKPCLFDLRHNDVESVIISHIAEYLGVGKILANDIDVDTVEKPIIKLNNDVKFLYEHLVGMG